MPRIRKKTSKRGTTHQRSKIKQKVAETRKKNKRDVKKNPQWKSKHNKDPGIPSNYPFKDEILAEIQQSRREAEEAKQKRKNDRKKTATAESEVPPDSPEASGEEQSEEVPQSVNAENESTSVPTIPCVLDETIAHLEAVLEQADVLIQVLDARVPLPFRSERLEQRFLEQKGKRSAFILNKIDLIPRESASTWLKVLRAEAVTIPFSNMLKEKRGTEDSEPAGFSALRHSLSCWAAERVDSNQTPLRVAFVGIANSGKSSIIDALCQDFQMPIYSPNKPGIGFSTTKYPVRVPINVDGHLVKLIDTPAIMRDYSKSGEDLASLKVRDMLLRNRGQIERVKDPLPAIRYILSRCKAEDLMVFYSLPAFAKDDVEAFLRCVARARGLLQKGGTGDINGAAKLVLRDWSANKLPYYSLPPETSSATSKLSDKVDLDLVSELAQKYDENALAGTLSRAAMWKGTGLILFAVDGVDAREVVTVSKPVEEAKDEGEDDEDEEEDEEEDEGGGGGGGGDADEDEAPMLIDQGKRKRNDKSLQVSRKRVSFAVGQKTRSRQVETRKKRSTGTSNGGGGDSYDFSQFF